MKPPCEASRVIVLFAVLMGVTAALIGLSLYLIVHSIRRIHRFEQMIRDIKFKHSAMAEFLA